MAAGRNAREDAPTEAVAEPDRGEVGGVINEYSSKHAPTKKIVTTKYR